MNPIENAPVPSPLETSTRREALKTGSKIITVSALAGISLPHVHAQGSSEVKLSLVGCGGRGTGAVKNALSVSGSLGPLKLHAMADVFENKLNTSHATLSKDPQVGDKIDVTPDRKFIGFDGYRHAMDALKPGDVVILTTPCAFRWVMFEYAIEKGLNVFMEKPLCPDGFSAPCPSTVILDGCCVRASYSLLPVGGELSQSDVLGSVRYLHRNDQPRPGSPRPKS